MSDAPKPNHEDRADADLQEAGRIVDELRERSAEAEASYQAERADLRHELADEVESKRPGRD